MDSELIPSSRARLPAARAAAISMSGTIGSVSSICRSAVAVMEGCSSAGPTSEGEEEGGSGLDPLRDPAEAIQRQKRDRIHGQHARQHVRSEEHTSELQSQSNLV